MVTVRRHHHIAPVEPMRRSATRRTSVRIGTSGRGFPFTLTRLQSTIAYRDAEAMAS